MLLRRSIAHFDDGRLAHAAGLKTVMVSNGTAEIRVLEELLPWIDAMNIDLKGFSDRYYKEVLGGDRRMVMEFIRRAAGHCHLELTCLIVPGENDTEEEMRAMAAWIEETCGKDTPLHVSRFFPRFHMKDRKATEVERVRRLAKVAGERLSYVYTGNC